MLNNDFFSKFVNNERERFSNIHNNFFALSFSQIIKYYRFLNIILGRYIERSKNFITSSKILGEAVKPNSKPSDELIDKLLEQQRETGELLHLEIESFYLFAKILLDKIARFIEFYFGQARNASLDSHDDLLKNIKKYVKSKGLTVIHSEMMQLIEELKRDVSDYRDYEIAHEKSPRTIKGTAYGDSMETARIINVKLYPKEKDKQIESDIPSKLMERIDRYIIEVTTYILKNQSSTNLKLRERESSCKI